MNNKEFVEFDIRFSKHNAKMPKCDITHRQTETSYSHSTSSLPFYTDHPELIGVRGSLHQSGRYQGKQCFYSFVLRFFIKVFPKEGPPAFQGIWQCHIFFLVYLLYSRQCLTDNKCVYVFRIHILASSKVRLDLTLLPRHRTSSMSSLLGDVNLLVKLSIWHNFIRFSSIKKERPILHFSILFLSKNCQAQVPILWSYKASHVPFPSIKLSLI